MPRRSNLAPSATEVPSSTSAPEAQPRCILAFAIEDSVDSAYYDGEHVHSLRLPFTDTRKGKNFFVELRKLLKSSIENLIRSSGFANKIEHFLKSFEVIVVSTPGVIEDNDALLQLPLWNWPDTPVVPEVSWKHEGEERRHFSFKNEICDIFAEIADAIIIDELRAKLYERIFVVNDVTAAAVYEYFLRKRDKRIGGFLYIKAHHGINIGVIEEDPTQVILGSDQLSALKIRTTHPEAGHFLPIAHEYDLAIDFPGTCQFHGSCVEGMVSTHSFYIRAKQFLDERFSSLWRFVSQLETQGFSAEEVSGRLIDRIIGNTPAQFHSLGVDLIATYIAQLVHRLAIGTLVPECIVLGGRMISPAVLTAIRDKITGWSNGYPRWERLNAGIGQFIVARSASRDQEDIADLAGAFILAQARAGVPYEKWKTLSKAQLLSSRENVEGNDDVVIALTEAMISKYAKKNAILKPRSQKPEE